MRAAFALIGLVEATKISSYSQGEEFDKCLSIADFETKDIGDDITLTDRDANGCCAAGTVPGMFLKPDYQGAQIVCGVGKGDQSYAAAASGKCSYGTCYVYKQNLPCADGTHQRLNGCCGVHGSTALTNLQTSCLGYEYTFTNTHDESVDYCLTYHEKYGSIGVMGTTAQADDVKYALQWLGGTPSETLKVCQGDCDTDGDCPTGSTCVDRTTGAETVDGCHVGDSHDASRADTDYCTNPGGTQKPELQISCIDEYSACCGHIARNGACDAPDFMAATNAALTTNACTGSVTAGSGGDSDSDSDDENNSTDTDNAAVASLGCAVFLAAGAMV